MKTLDMNEAKSVNGSGVAEGVCTASFAALGGLAGFIGSAGNPAGAWFGASLGTTVASAICK